MRTAIRPIAMPAHQVPDSGLRTIRHLSLETRADFGIGAAAQLPHRAAAMGIRRPGLIIDGAVAEQAIMRSLLVSWEGQGMTLATVFHARTGCEPDYAYLDQVAEQIRSLETDAIIGLGGGSTLDLAKGVGLLLRNPGPSLAYRGMDKVRHPGVPVILIPTTAGSGSEATATASFIDRATMTKLGINGRHVGCALSILDPSLLVGCPVSVTMSSGLDALVHAIEAVTATTAHTISILFGVEAVRLMFAGLLLAVREPEDLQARADTQLGSYYAAMAMRNVGGGPASGISYPLGVHYGVPHGFAGGILLPHVVSHNIAHGYTEGYARLYERLPDARMEEDDAAKAAAFEAALWALYRSVEPPATLSRWNVRRAQVPALAALALEQRSGNLAVNPVPFGRDETVALLQAVTE